MKSFAFTSRALVVIVVAAGLFRSQVGAAASDNCSAEALRQRCDAVLPDLLEEEQKSAVRARSNSKIELGDSYRFAEAVKNAKLDLIEEIRKGRDKSELTQAERDLISKVETVTYIPPDHALVKNREDCPKNSPNAFYSGLNHSITLCPSLVVQSDAALAYSVGHELFHMMDPCNINHDVFAVRVSDLIATRNSLGPLSFVKKSRLDTAIQFIKASGRMTLNPDNDVSFMPDLKKVTDLVPRSSLTKVLGGVDETQSPFRKAIECLAHEPFQFRAGGANACSEKNEMNEAMSDFMGARLLGRYFERNRPRSDLERFQALGSLAKGVCGPRSGGEKTDEHASYADRLSKIVMTEPSVRRAFGCAETSRSCYHTLDATMVTSPKGRSEKGASKIKKTIR